MNFSNCKRHRSSPLDNYYSRSTNDYLKKIRKEQDYATTHQNGVEGDNLISGNILCELPCNSHKMFQPPETTLRRGSNDYVKKIRKEQDYAHRNDVEEGEIFE